MPQMPAEAASPDPAQAPAPEPAPDLAPGAQPRRLAAILAVDVVDFTRRLDRDEAAAIAQIRILNRDVLRPAVAAYGGRVFKMTGDGMLAEFASAVAAVECAARIQAPRRAAGETDAAPLLMRIGIGLGEVTAEGEDLLGAAVTLACRLQTHAEPGGVCVTGAVRAHARAAAAAGFAPLGALHAKGFEAPVEAWRLTPAGDALDPAPAPPPPRSRAAGPSLAVAPFEESAAGGGPDGMGPDGMGDPWFADGMAEELVASLSRLPWLTVIARHSTMALRARDWDMRALGRDLGVRYVVTGAVRRAAGRLRIGVRLAEAETGAQLWSARFEAGEEDIFDLQDRIAAGVVGAIEPALRRAEIDRVKRKRPDDLDAYDLFLRALSFMYQVTPDARETARGLADQALALAPDYAEAHGVAAWLYFAQTLWEGRAATEAQRVEALGHARAVQASGVEDATTLAHAAIVLALADGALDEARDLIDRALAANPGSAQAHGHGAVIATWAGDAARCHALAARALELSPCDPLNVMPHAAMAGSHLVSGAFEPALAAARQALLAHPTHAPASQIAVIALMRLGRGDEARRMATRFMALCPGFRLRPGAPVFAHFQDELAAAGLPRAEV